MGKPYSKHCEDLFAMGFQSGIGPVSYTHLTLPTNSLV